MTLAVAYFQPVIMAMDDVAPAEFSKIFNLAEQLHGYPQLNDSGDPNISIRGGQQIQVYPNEINYDATWLVRYLESMCQGYMDLVTTQSGGQELQFVKPKVISIWTIRQSEGDYQEMHTHPLANLSGNIYISVPELDDTGRPSDCQINFRLPHVKDVGKFIMNDTWKFTPAAGKVILFPSHLPHVVYPWKGRGHRTVMAFDCKLVPKDEQDS
jgi:Putative 2OG-Fe(II) oxygenase